MVIISAGALSTPQILQRSGLGDAARLKTIDIEPVVDLPGVGQNYQDHQVIGTAASRIHGALDETVNEVLHSDSKTLAQRRSGSLARNFVDTGIKMRPTEEEVQSMGPEFAKVWRDYFADKPDKPLMWVGIFSTYDILKSHQKSH
jgi:alcohol oxidase